MKYFFILGKNNKLSLVEILAVLDDLSIPYKIVENIQNVLIIEVTEAFDIDGIFKRLAGTIKVGKIFNKTIQISYLDQDSIFLKSQIINEYNKSKKLFFGFSLYSLGEKDNIKALNFLSKKIHSFGIKLKKELASENIKSRFVISKDLSLSSVVVKKNKLLNQGKEICFFKKGSKVFVGQTINVQDFEKFSMLDYGRPKRDSKRGMLPPKLAQIMINLAQVKKDEIIFDPFCGSGTILTQAYLSGYKNFIGSDKSSQAVKDSKQNISWIKEKLKLYEPRIKIFLNDIKEIGNDIQDNSIDAIITEPFLGPPLNGNESKSTLIKITKDLSDLYLQSFKIFKKVLKKGGRVVIIIPRFKYKDELICVPIEDLVKDSGLKMDRNYEKYYVSDDERALTYQRESQFLQREVYKLKMAK